MRSSDFPICYFCSQAPNGKGLKFLIYLIIQLMLVLANIPLGVERLPTQNNCHLRVNNATLLKVFDFQQFFQKTGAYR